MELKFEAGPHKYSSLNDPSKVWTSVTGLVGMFKEPFDKDAVAQKSSKSKKGKWAGMCPEKILEVWDKENKRALTLGTWYHDQREQELLSHETLRRSGLDLEIFHPLEQDGIKLSPDQQLTSGIYPELLVYLKSASLCGQADRVEVVGDTVNIYDYKTNKEIKTEGYTSWEGVTSKLKPPISHLDDCHVMHYALQLSIYMYIILKHNHSLKPGILEIHHILFEIESEDEFGYPIVKTDEDGNPIVKEVVPYPLPYLKKEVMAMIKYMKTYPELFKK